MCRLMPLVSTKSGQSLRAPISTTLSVSASDQIINAAMLTRAVSSSVLILKCKRAAGIPPLRYLSALCAFLRSRSAYPRVSSPASSSKLEFVVARAAIKIWIDSKIFEDQVSKVISPANVVHEESVRLLPKFTP